MEKPPVIFISKKENWLRNIIGFIIVLVFVFLLFFIPNKKHFWGAYVGGVENLSSFESLTGKKTNFYAHFENWEDNNFPKGLSSEVGEAGKTLIIFWEPNFGYDNIIDGSKDSYIKQFAADAKNYSYPIILVPFDEMNLNEAAWQYGQNNNSAEKFKIAWRHLHDLFNGVPNVKFGLAYNYVSIPNIPGNYFNDYYPGDKYVDYVGVDGFSWTNQWQSFDQVFDGAINELNTYKKPIIIFSVAAEANPKKAKWIADGLGSHIKKYKNVIGWVWFNQGGSPNWTINSDNSSLNAFKKVLP